MNQIVDALDLKLRKQCNGIAFHQSKVNDFDPCRYFAYHDAYEIYNPNKSYCDGTFVNGDKKYQNVAYQIKLVDDKYETVETRVYMVLYQVFEGTEQQCYDRYCQCEWCQMSWFNTKWLRSQPEDYGCLKYYRKDQNGSNCHDPPNPKVLLKTRLFVNDYHKVFK